jgi:hypothetical protein
MRSRVELMRTASVRRAAVIALAILGVAAVEAGAAGARTRAAFVRVTLSSTGILVAPGSVVAGKVVFKVRNTTGVPRDFEIGGKKTAAIAPGSAATLTAALAARPYRYVSVGRPPAARLSGLLGVLPPCTRPAKTSVTATITLNQISLSRTAVPCGTVSFAITNSDTQDYHDLNFALSTLVGGNVLGRRLAPGQSTTMVVKFPYKGRVYYFCQEPEHAENGEAGFLTVR